jgi:stage IV sporulation protein B
MRGRQHLNVKQVFLIFVLTLMLVILSQIPFSLILDLPNMVKVDEKVISQLNNEKYFGKYISACLDGETTTSTNPSDSNIFFKLKLFNFITIKTIKANTEHISVYAGGIPVGFSLNSDGVIVMGSSFVLTKEGSINTLQNSTLKNGDIIKQIGGEEVKKIGDIKDIINREENKDKELKIVAKRKDKNIETTIKPALDLQSKTYKLGLWVKDDASGIGTLTYVRADNNRFGALGHAISDIDTKLPFNVDTGEMYHCSIIGLNKGVKGKPGEIKGLFLQGRNCLGTVDKNNNFGVFGVINLNSDILEKKELLEAGGRLTARPGKAKIRVSVDGNTTHDYDIEIIKTNYQANSNEKSMVIRVTDEALLKLTGGIIQGMSGSPIIQNNKVVGAVTHVFVSDPTKGFGVYLDWMFNQ